jgi:hypothetical protein
VTYRTLLSNPRSLQWADWLRRIFDWGLGLPALAIGVAAIWYPNGKGSGSAPGVGWLAFFVFSAIWILVRRAMKAELGALKAVSIDKKFIYVSDRAQEIAIPLSSISSVTEDRATNYHPVTVRFKTRTDFGNEITFMPTSRLTFTLTGYQPSHPVVKQLQDAVRSTHEEQ